MLQNYSRFAEPTDTDDGDNMAAIELAADAIEDAAVEVDDDDYRHALALVIARDIARNGRSVSEIDRLAPFMRRTVEQFRAVKKIYAEGEQ